MLKNLKYLLVVMELSKYNFSQYQEGENLVFINKDLI